MGVLGFLQVGSEPLFLNMVELSPSRPLTNFHEGVVFNVHLLPDCVFTWLREGKRRG